MLPICRQMGSSGDSSDGRNGGSSSGSRTGRHQMAAVVAAVQPSYH
jgi:hypothetical protein